MSTSPALVLSGFGITGPVPSDQIDSVTATVNCWTSAAGMGPLAYELRDEFGNLIGTATGTASTSTAHYDTVIFPPPDWNQLAGLRLLIYADQGSASSGSVASVDYAAMSVSYLVTGIPYAIAPAGQAAAAAAAPAPGVPAAVNAGLAAAAASAPPAAVQRGVTASAGLAAAGTTAASPALILASNAFPGPALASAAAPQASGGTSKIALPGPAAAAAAAPAPAQIAYGLLAFPGLAAAAGSAGAPRPAITFTAGLGAAQAVAPSPPPRVVRGLVTGSVAAASVTGTGTVTAAPGWSGQEARELVTARAAVTARTGTAVTASPGAGTAAGTGTKAAVLAGVTGKAAGSGVSRGPGWVTETGENASVTAGVSAQ
jgi:hypothetical protein